MGTFTGTINFVGHVLPNGATVLAQVREFVLCEWPRKGESRQYVTWIIDDKGHTHAGHYFGECSALYTRSPDVSD